MGIGEFFNFGGSKLPSAPTKRVDVRVTPKGVDKMRRGLLEPLQFEVISIISRLQPCNSDDVARNMQPPRNIDMIRECMRGMESNGLIQIEG